jgi:multiple antibiotic resistance protein
MSFAGYMMLAFSSLIVTLDPLGAVPSFLAMTERDTPAQRLRMARLASQTVAGLLAAFALFGKWIFSYLGITIAAFQMAGSAVLMFIAMDMIRAERTRTSETREEVEAGAAKDDIAITPLATPILAGPGSISTVILLQSKADTWWKIAILLFTIGIVSALTYLILGISVRGAKWLSPIVLRLTTRIMGLMLAAIACQFLLNALRDVGIAHFGN